MKHPIEKYGKPAPAGPGKDAYQVKKESGQRHNTPKSRQDGQGSKHDTSGKGSLWTHSNSEGVDPNA